ncbi:MAG: pathogenesis-related family 1 protein [Bacteroidota bacterium]
MLLAILLFPAACKENSDDDVMNEAVVPDDTEISELLDAHNAYRKDVGIDDLLWSEDLQASAQNWANLLAANCEFKHSSDPYGENIWKGTSGAFTPTDVVKSWGSEIEFYDYGTNSCTDVCGHYTQIVWKNTTHVGCAKASCDGTDVWVCQYDPPGNFIGQKPY